MADLYVPWIDISFWQLGVSKYRDFAAASKKVDYARPAKRGVKAVKVRLMNGNGTPSSPPSDKTGMVDGSCTYFADGYRAAGMHNLLGYAWPSPTASLPVQLQAVRNAWTALGGLPGPIALDLEDANRSNPTQWKNVIDYFVKGCQDITQRPLIVPLFYTADWWWNSTLAGYNANWSQYHNLEAEYPGQPTDWPSRPDFKRPPSDATQWATWALSKRPSGPSTSRGWVGWDSWQFTSALVAGDFGFPTGNAGLDGNIARAVAFAQWFSGVQIPDAPLPAPTPGGQVGFYMQSDVPAGAPNPVFEIIGNCKRQLDGANPLDTGQLTASFPEWQQKKMPMMTSSQLAAYPDLPVGWEQSGGGGSEGIPAGTYPATVTFG